MINGGVTNAGKVTSSGTINGGVVNKTGGLVTSSGVINDGVTNAGTVTSSGTINGGVVNKSGGTVTTTGIVTGGVTNAGTVNAEGKITGAVVNDNIFNVTGALTGENASTFTNNATGALNVTGGNYIKLTTLTNTGTVTIADGKTLAAGVINNNGGSIGVGKGSTLQGTSNTLNNAATINVATDGK